MYKRLWEEDQRDLYITVLGSDRKNVQKMSSRRCWPVVRSSERMSDFTPSRLCFPVILTLSDALTMDFISSYS